MPQALQELLNFIYRDFPMDHQFAKLSAAPVPEVPPIPWLLGTSKKSAILAADLGISYAFGQFMSEQDGTEIIKKYRDAFKPGKTGSKPEVLLTVNAYCAETTEKAEEMALSSLIWRLQRQNGGYDPGVPSIEEAKKYEPSKQEKEQLNKMKQKMIIGNPSEVKAKLLSLKECYYADEIMIVTITYFPEDKIRSYQLIAEEIL